MNQKKIGIILSFSLIFIKLLTTFFYIPFILSILSKEDYGLFSVVGAVISYITILDFGINDSTLRYFIKFKNESSENNKIKILSSISIIYSFLALLVILMSIVIYFNLSFFFKGGFTIEEISTLKKMFIISSISIFFTITFNPIGAILNAYEKFIFLKTTQILSFILTTALIVVFLSFGYNIIMMVTISATINILSITIKFLYVRANMKIDYPKYKYSKKLVKKILLYSSPIFLVVIVEQIYWKLDNILIGAILGTKLVTFYAIGIIFQKYILSFSSSISRIMTPDLISKIDLKLSQEDLTTNYIKVSRIQFLVVIFIVSNLVYWGNDFLIIWLGNEYQISYTVLLLIMIPFAIEIIGNLRNVFLQVYNYYWYRGIILLIISVFNIALTIYFLKKYGVVGAAASTSIGLFIGYIATNYLLYTKVKINLYLFFKNVWFKSIPIIIFTTISFIITKYIIEINSWISLITSASITSLVYILSVWFMYLDKEEKNHLKI